MGWSYREYEEAPVEFIEACIHFANKDAER